MKALQRSKLKELEKELASQGRELCSITPVENTVLREAYNAEVASMHWANEMILYHTTTCSAAKKIAQAGFIVTPAADGSTSAAFGEGVNLASTANNALLYTFGRQVACTLLCTVAVGKSHANESRHVPGVESHTVPVRLHPKRGYDSMYGMDGWIFVAPRPSRVLPLTIVKHTRVTR